MSGPPRILLALTPLVERTIETDLFGSQTTVEVIASAAEADELEELAHTHNADALVISPDLSGLTGAHCARATAAGLRVIGVALDDVGRDALGAFGVDDVLVPPLQDGALAAAANGPAHPPADQLAPHRSSPPLKSTNGSSVVAVIGSQGAPGASECAASLAALAATRWDTVLAEVDALGTSLDVRLGADPLQGSLAGLARAVQNDEPRLSDLLERWIITRPSWPSVLLGAPDPTRDLAHPGTTSHAIRTLAGSYPLVVCDVGFLIATDGSSPAARIHRETIAIADAVVLILGARDVQLRHGLAQLDELSDGLELAPERLRVVVNGTGAPGAGSRLEIESALLPRLAERSLGVDCWIPWDRRALTLARKRGLPLATARPRGPYRRAIEQLLHELFLPAAPVTRAHKHRLAPAQTTPANAARDEEVALPWRG